MAIYLVELPLKVRLYQDGATPEKEGSIKFVVDADDSQEATNIVAVMLGDVVAGEAGDSDDAPLTVLS